MSQRLLEASQEREVELQAGGEVDACTCQACEEQRRREKVDTENLAEVLGFSAIPGPLVFEPEAEELTISGDLTDDGVEFFSNLGAPTPFKIDFSVPSQIPPGLELGVLVLVDEDGAELDAKVLIGRYEDSAYWMIRGVINEDAWDVLQEAGRL